MNNRANLKSVHVDEDFPQLQEIVKGRSLATTLQQYMGESFASGEMQVEDCRKNRIYYKSGADCRIRFTAIIRNCQNQEVSEQLFFGQLSRTRPKQPFGDFLNPKQLTQPKFGPSVIYIPEWSMVLWAYPNDPELPGLSLMVNPENVLARMKAEPARFNLHHSPVAITARLTKYVPGKRCGYVYNVTHGSTRAPGVNDRSAIYGKAYRGKDGEIAYSILTQIWQTEASKSGELLLSQPYNYDPENRIVWQEALNSPSLAKIAGTVTNLPEIGEEIGRRLAAFHGTDLELREEMSLDFQIRELRAKITTICDAFPEHKIECNEVVQRLITRASQIGPGPLRPIHASFKLSHIFAEEKGITFIDFDGANLGDPGYDLGRFIAHLYRMTLNGKIQSGIAEQTVARFCEAYNRAAFMPVPQERINWFTASHLVCSEACRIVKRVAPDSVRELLRIADDICRERKIQG